MKSTGLQDIPEYRSWEKIQPIDKGWSSDQKYYIENANKEKFLLRISEEALFDKKKYEFQQMQKLVSMGFIMSIPISFGKCNENKNVYGLFTWIEGEALDDKINQISKENQYKLGVSAGKTLKKFHEITVNNSEDNIKHDWKEKYKRWLQRYKNGNERFSGDEATEKFISDQIDILDEITEVKKHFLHGDFHLGNMILQPNGELAIIDFNRWGYGEIYEDFLKDFWFSREKSIEFARGQIDGYFENKIPEYFFEIMSIYLAREFFIGLAWAAQIDEEQINGMIKRIEMTLKDFKNFTAPYPIWYIM